jgi:hypothetical protein
VRYDRAKSGVENNRQSYLFRLVTIQWHVVSDLVKRVELTATRPPRTIAADEWSRNGAGALLRENNRKTEMVIRALGRFSLPHRLMDFNNLPETRFEDVKQVLRVASERIAARLESKQ